MAMALKKPLRTYQRKTTNKSSVNISLVPTVFEKYHIQHNNFGRNYISNDSLTHDPFETTFDRIAKDAVVPPLPLDTNQNDSWNSSSSFETDNVTNHMKSPKHISSEQFIYNNTSSLMKKNIKLNRERKGKNKYNSEIMISMRTMSKKAKKTLKKDIVSMAEKKQGQKGQKEKIPKSQRKRKTKYKSAESSHTDNGQIGQFNVPTNLENAQKDEIFYNNNSKYLHKDICKTDEVGVILNTLNQVKNSSATLTCTVDYHQIMKSCFVKLEKCTIQNSSSSNSEQITEAKQSLLRDHEVSEISKEELRKKLKTCSVVLFDNVKDLEALTSNKESMGDSIEIENTTNTSSSALGFNLHKTVSCRNVSVDDLTFGENRDEKYKIRKSYVKIKKLEETLKKKQNVVTNVRNPHMISSTPIGKCLRSSSSFYPKIVLSPIDTNSFNAPDLNCEKITAERDISVNKYHTHSSVTSDIQEQLTQLLMSQILQTNSTVGVAQTSEDEIYNALTQKKNDAEDDVEVKYSLDISANTNRSRSLFDDMTENYDLTESAVAYKDVQEKHESVNGRGTDIPLRLSVDHTLKSLLEDDAYTDKITSDLLLTDIKIEMPENLSNIKYTEQICKIEKTTDNVEIVYEDRTNLSVNGGNEIKSQDEVSISDFDDGDTLSKKLQDSIRFTERKVQIDPKWHLYVPDVLESSKNGVMPSNNVELLENRIQDNTNDTSMQAERRSIFLMPGKYWARSLSILNNINAESDLNKLSVGKGKKWKQSVRDILDMQKSGTFQNCSNKDQDDADLFRRKFDELDVSTFADNSYKALNSMNRDRFSRRISIRVVPNQNASIKYDGKNYPFLEAYGLIKIEESDDVISEVSCRKQLSICDAQYNRRITRNQITVKDIVLQRCSQNYYLQFSECYSDSYLEHCCKIGEGVFGEVFLYENGDKKSVIKIIPIEGEELVNDEPQKKFSEILSEIVIAEELYNLRYHDKYQTNGFVEVQRIKCIIGKYPQKLIKLWNTYDDENRSDNDCPSMFGENQLYIALELGHGGQPFEAFMFQNAEEAYAIFLQIALALAVAEQALEFEHRDMHWGNVLITKIKEPYVYYNLGGKEIKCPSKGVKVSIIDYTLSRILYEGCYIYNDLAQDSALFTAYGEYQFEIYRLMRDKNQNDWQRFEPYTNILWLHYTLDKMVTAARYKRKTTKTHKQAISKLEKLKDIILNYGSVYDFVSNDISITCLYSSSR